MGDGVTDGGRDQRSAAQLAERSTSSMCQLLRKIGVGAERQVRSVRLQGAYRNEHNRLTCPRGIGLGKTKLGELHFCNSRRKTLPRSLRGRVATNCTFCGAL